MFKRTLIPLVALCLSVPSLLGQPPANKLPLLPEAKPEDILCKCVTTFQIKKEDVFFFKVGEKYFEVALAGEAISQTFPVRGSTTFALYKEVTDDEDKTTYIPVVQQALTGLGKSHLITLKRKDDNSPITSTSQSLSTSELPANSIHFFNNSPAPLGVQINTTKTVVKPYTKYTYPFKNTTRDTYTSAKVVMRYKGENKIMSSKRLRLVPGRRVILVAFPSRTRAKLGSTPLRMLVLQDAP